MVLNYVFAHWHVNVLMLHRFTQEDLNKTPGLGTSPSSMTTTMRAIVGQRIVSNVFVLAARRAVLCLLIAQTMAHGVQTPHS